MSTNALTLHEESPVPAISRSNQITDVQRLGGLLAASGYFSDAREMAQAAVKVMAGQELGIPPVAAMMGINIIKGKVALGGNLIASRIRAHGYEYRHKRFDNSGCVLEFLSKPDANGKRTVLGEASFTEEDAKTAGVFTDMYRKYPRNMYFNRSISNGAKWYTPEVFAGAPVYVPEELGANVDENGDMIHPEPTREQQTQARKEVQDRKLAEIRQRHAQPPEPIDPPASEEPEQAQSSTLEQILASFAQTKNIEPAFAQMRGVLDSAVFDGILIENGMGPGEPRTVGKARKAFAALWAAYQRQMDETAAAEVTE